MALLSSFITQASSIGLPVKMLSYVQQHYDLGTTTKPRGFTDPSRNRFRLNEDKAADLKSAAIGGAVTDGKVTFHDEEDAVNELYHEATHAYIDLKLDEARAVPHRFRRLIDNGPQLAARRVEAVIAEAASYYDVTMVKGRLTPIVGEGSDIAHEAAAMYIGRRASMYWRTVDALAFNRDWLNKKIRSKDTEQVDEESKGIFTLQAQYNKVMADLVQGYYTTGITWFVWSNKKQREVQGRKIPSTLKAMCDDLLEHKIPYHFSAAALLSRLAVENWKLIATLREMK